MNFLRNIKLNFLFIIRDKMGFFWNTMFPIVFVTICVLAFNNAPIKKIETNIGMKKDNPYYKIVQNIEYLKIKEPSNDILKDLRDKKYDCFVNDDLSLNITENKLKITIAKSIFDSIKQMNETKIDKNEIIKNLNKSFVENSFQKNDYIKYMLYSALIMTAMYGAFGSVKLTQNILYDNGSEVATRVLMSPSSKSNYLLSSISASILLDMINLNIVIFYIQYILNFKLLNNYLLTMLLLFVTNIFAVTLGTFISVFVKGNIKSKSQVILATILFSNYTSGMTGQSVVIKIKEYIPFFAKINPAMAIQNGLSAVNDLGNLKYVQSSLIYLLLLSSILFTLSVLKLRRN